MHMVGWQKASETKAVVHMVWESRENKESFVYGAIVPWFERSGSQQ